MQWSIKRLRSSVWMTATTLDKCVYVWHVHEVRNGASYCRYYNGFNAWWPHHHQNQDPWINFKTCWVFVSVSYRTMEKAHSKATVRVFSTQWILWVTKICLAFAYCHKVFSKFKSCRSERLNNFSSHLWYYHKLNGQLFCKTHSVVV